MCCAPAKKEVTDIYCERLQIAEVGLAQAVEVKTQHRRTLIAQFLAPQPDSVQESSP